MGDPTPEAFALSGAPFATGDASLYRMFFHHCLDVPVEQLVTRVLLGALFSVFFLLQSLANKNFHAL